MHIINIIFNFNYLSKKKILTISPICQSQHVKFDFNNVTYLLGVDGVTESIK